jgi:hypothetical protein
MIVDDLIRGAFDVHVHGYPEIAFKVRTRGDDLDIARSFYESGMKGFVLKSHLWPTVGRVYHLAKVFPDLAILPSITLNHTSGGINPLSVESAASQGARVVFMPTWSAENDLRNGGFSDYIRSYFASAAGLIPEQGISLLDNRASLRPEVHEVLEVAKAYNLVIATGHISPQESLALMEEANLIGAVPVIFSHPFSRSVGATIESMKHMADLGAYVEICALGLMPAFQSLRPADIVRIVSEIGAERCLLSTDFFFEWAPPAPEMLRMVVGTLLEKGFTEDQLARLVRENPRSLFGLSPDLPRQNYSLKSEHGLGHTSEDFEKGL